MTRIEIALDRQWRALCLANYIASSRTNRGENDTRIATNEIPLCHARIADAALTYGRCHFFVLHCCNYNQAFAPIHRYMIPARRFFRRQTALQLLAVLLLLAQTLGLMHGVAHAGQRASQAMSAQGAGDGSGWNDLFGHSAGAACDDWSAAFAPDANPAAGHVDIPAVRIESCDLCTESQPAFVAAPNGFFLARAPPRA